MAPRSALDVLLEQGRGYTAQGNWADLVTLCRTGAGDLPEADREHARVPLLRMEVLGLAHQLAVRERRDAQLQREREAALEAALEALAQNGTPFHRFPEFEDYLGTLDPPSSAMTGHGLGMAYAQLVQACQDSPRIRRVSALRAVAKVLLERAKLNLTEPGGPVTERIHRIQHELEPIYAATLFSNAFTDADRTRVAVYLVELRLLATIPEQYCSLDSDDYDLDDEEMTLLNAVSELTEVRDRLTDPALGIWHQIIYQVFADLSRGESNTLAQVRELALRLQDDLVAAGGAILLAFLEHDHAPDAALRHYVMHLDAAPSVGEDLMADIKELWQQADNLAEVEGFVSALEGEQHTSSRPEAILELLDDATARRTALSRQDRIDKAAPVRWRSLKSPVQKLFGVLLAIEEFDSFEELGECAGMDSRVVRRHYDTLLDTGIIFQEAGEEGRYRINPHMRTIAEQESQPAVLARAIQMQGTTAIRPLFRSQQERTVFDIVTEFCPNCRTMPNYALQSFIDFDRVRELVDRDDFRYFLQSTVDILVASSSTDLPLFGIEVDSVWHDTEEQQVRDARKDRLFSVAGIRLLRLRLVGSPSEAAIRVGVAEHLDALLQSSPNNIPGYDAQACRVLESIARGASPSNDT